MSNQRLKIQISGTVQGVGFRPFVYRLAQRYGLTGWVINSGHGVTLEVQGEQIDPFIRALQQERPPQAQIATLQSEAIPLKTESGFTILSSSRGAITTAIPVDSALCAACLQELFDLTSRYYRYPFIGCSHCGPRYTLIHRLPYDRVNSSMSHFALCSMCQAEYDDPNNRRFHAQAIACPACGPQLSMAADEIVRRLHAGEIIALKGVGGFHLLCDAHNEAAVKKLRQRKQRAERPLAIMVANLASAHALVECDAVSAALLTSAARPIVLLRKKTGVSVATEIAPQLPWLGLLIAYTPLHYLLFHAAAGEPSDSAWLTKPQRLTLVITSANGRGEPLLIDNRAARERLVTLADTIVDHDCTIVSRCDDSVMRVINQRPTFIRRARGFAPQAIKLAHAIPSTLAVGGHLKNSLCITRGDEAFLSQHIGDMESRATLRSFEEICDHLLSLLQVTPQRVAHDLHPDFVTTHFAQGLSLPCYAIQHHHAHLAAVAAEQQITHPAIGLALDGYGLGSDHGAWGGELLLIHGAQCQRLGHLAPLKILGGELAVREPWRLAAAFLQEIGRGDEIMRRFGSQPAAPQLAQLLASGVPLATTSSGGRLFDTAAALLGVRLTSSFEGQAPLLLEGLVTQPTVMTDGWFITEGQLDLTPLLTRLLNCDPIAGANLFHGTLIAALCDWLLHALERHNSERVLLSGGCFLNAILAEGIVTQMRAWGITPHLPSQAPPNDGGLSLGQAWVAGNS